MTAVNDPRVLRYCIEQHEGLVADMKALLGPKNFTTILDFQPIPSYFADIGVQKGATCSDSSETRATRFFSSWE